MSDLIDRQAAIDELISEPPEMNYGFYYAEKIKALPSAQPDLTEEDWKLIKKLRSFHNGTYAKALDKLMLSAQQEPTLEQIEEYCRKRGLSIVDNTLLHKYAQAEIQPDIIGSIILSIGYKGCQNCVNQIEPMRMCEWAERGGNGCVYWICPKWERRTDERSD